MSMYDKNHYNIKNKINKDGHLSWLQCLAQENVFAELGLLGWNARPMQYQMTKQIKNNVKKNSHISVKEG